MFCKDNTGLTSLSAIRHHVSDRFYRIMIYSYWLFLVIPLIINANVVFIGWFYLFVCTGLIVTIRRNMDVMRMALFHPLGIMIGLLFLYTLLHALLLTENWQGLSQTIRHTLANAAFLLATLLVWRLSPDMLYRLLRIMLVFAGVMALISILWYIIIGALGQRLEPFGRFDHAILGANVYTVWALTGFIYIHPAIKRGKYDKILLLTVLLMVGIMIVFTQSRGPLLAFMLSIGAGLFLTGHYRIFGLCASLALAVVADLLYYDMTGSSLLPLDEFYQLLIQLFERESHRLAIWQIALNLIAEKPFTGYGMRAGFPYGFGGVNPHNLFLSAWYYVGVAGFFLLVIITLTACFIGWRKRHHPLGMLTLLLMLHAIMACFTDQGQYVKTPSALWIIYWLPVGIAWSRCVKPLQEPETIDNIAI